MEYEAYPEAYPETLTPQNLMTSNKSSVALSGHDSNYSSVFDNWSNWGNGPTDPGYTREGLEKTLS